MKITPLIAGAMLAFALAGCSNQYFERQDKVTFSAGDAVAWNNAQQIPNPSPRRAQNTNIATNGEKGVMAVRRDIDGRYEWYTEPSDTSGDLKDTILQGDTPKAPPSPAIVNNVGNSFGPPPGGP